jgi:hypothetical protein
MDDLRTVFETMLHGKNANHTLQRLAASHCYSHIHHMTCTLWYTLDIHHSLSLLAKPCSLDCRCHVTEPKLAGKKAKHCKIETCSWQACCMLTVSAAAVLFCLCSSHAQAQSQSKPVRNPAHRLQPENTAAQKLFHTLFACVLFAASTNQRLETPGEVTDQPSHAGSAAAARLQAQGCSAHVQLLLLLISCCCSYCICWWLKPAEVKGEGLAAVLVKVAAHSHQRISLHSHSSTEGSATSAPQLPVSQSDGVPASDRK